MSPTENSIGIFLPWVQQTQKIAHKPAWPQTHPVVKSVLSVISVARINLLTETFASYFNRSYFYFICDRF